MWTGAVIGRGPLAVATAALLRETGHRLRAVVTPDSQVAAWATANGVERLRLARQLDDIDYLFSIANGEILDEAALAIPRRLAINFHNGPLPRYAGVHVSSWALLDGAREHGITWHVMVPRIDAGDVLAQVTFPVAAGETTASLNERCQQHGLMVLRQLVADLDGGRVTRRPQALAERRYHAGARRHPSGGLLSWEASADELDRICRAHTFGQAPNAMGLPRLLVGDEPVVVGALAPTEVVSTAVPGTVLEVGAALRVASGSVDVLVSALRSLDGQPFDVGSLRVGQRLPSPDAALQARLAALGPHEPFWLSELAHAAAQKKLLDAAMQQTPTDAATQQERRDAALQNKYTIQGDDLTALTARLVALDRGAPFTVGVITPRTRAAAAGLEPFCAAALPLRLAFDGARGPAAEAHVAAQLRLVEEHAPCPRDLPLRYPTRVLSLRWPLLVELAP